MFDILYGISALNLSEQYAIFGVLAVAIIGLWYTWFLKKQVMANDAGTGKMVEVWTAIKQGADTYLKKQLKSILPMIVILTVCLFLSVYIVPVSAEAKIRFQLTMTEQLNLSLLSDGQAVLF